jgi:hypothetical protein
LFSGGGLSSPLRLLLLLFSALCTNVPDPSKTNFVIITRTRSNFLEVEWKFLCSIERLSSASVGQLINA